MNLISILVALFGIGLLIFVHESGHFLAARAAGVRVEVFSLGFGPRLWGFRWRDTDFRLSAVPFGGYVLVAGADPSDRRYPPSQSLYAKSLMQRMVFWSGGVVMNVLFALIVFPIVFGAGVNFTAPVVGTVQYGSAAWESEIQPGDRVLSVQGRHLHSLDNLAVEIALHGQRAVDILIERDGEQRVVTVTPHFNAERKLYELGVDPTYLNFMVEVESGGPAASAGLRKGDELLTVNGREATREAIVAAREFGAPLTFEAKRGDEVIAGTISTPKKADPLPGLIGISTLPRKVVGLRRADWLDRLGLRHDDVILAIDGRAFLVGDLEPYTVGPATLRLDVVGGDGQARVLEQQLTPAQRGELASRIALGRDDSLRVLPSPDQPSALAGVLPGDLVEAIDGKAIANWDAMRKIVLDAKGQPLRLRLRRLPPDTASVFDPDSGDLPRGEAIELVVTPPLEPQFDYGFVASAPPLQQELRAVGFGDALRLGAVCSIDLLKQSYVTLKRLITGDVGANNLGGIVRITQVSYMAAQRGPSWFWYFLALISVNLAFVNLLPIPVLDGGHLLFLLIEKVKGSPVSARVFGYSQVVGLVFVLLLVLFVTYNDILRLL